MPGTTSSIIAPAGKTGIALAVAALAAAALFVRHKSIEAEKGNPPAGKFLEIDGVRLHYIERGSGDPVVLLHGNGSMINDFSLCGVIDAVAQQHRVIAFDRPGFGHTPRPTGQVWNQAAQAELVYEALQQLGIASATVVGHSWGTMVAAALALAHPDAVGRLVLISGYYYPTPRLDVPAMSMPAVPVIGTVLRHTVSPLLARLFWPLISKQLFGPAPVSESFRRWPIWMTLRPSQLRASAADTAMMIPGAMQMAQRYAELRMPVTVLAGDGDKIVDPKAQSERLGHALPASDVQIIPGAGHMLHHIDPAVVIAAIYGDEQRPSGIQPATAAIPDGQAGGLASDATSPALGARGPGSRRGSALQ